MKLLLLLMPSTLFELQEQLTGIKDMLLHLGTLPNWGSIHLLYFYSSPPAPQQKAGHSRLALPPLKFKSKKTPHALTSFQKNK